MAQGDPDQGVEITNIYNQLIDTGYQQRAILANIDSLSLNETIKIQTHTFAMDGRTITTGRRFVKMSDAMRKFYIELGNPINYDN